MIVDIENKYVRRTTAIAWVALAGPFLIAWHLITEVLPEICRDVRHDLREVW